MITKSVFTSESVTEGHPDKICDQISDSILDEILKNDLDARVAVECAVTAGLVLVMGEVTTKYQADYEKIVRDTIRDIGYSNPVLGFDANSCYVLSKIQKQSEDIALGVNSSKEYKTGNGRDKTYLLGAGDQGMMFGYACDETPELIPAPIAYAHKVTKQLARARKTGELKWLRPDGKSQVTVQYDDAGKVERIATIVVSAQHDPDVGMHELHEGIMDCVIKPAIGQWLIDGDTNILINPTGRFVSGGPAADSGLTGRKIIVDTYGGFGGHGGGCFSGKDPTKVDRTGAYMARYVAKNVVASGLARRCQIQIAYAIGVATPVSIVVDSFGTGRVPDYKITQLVSQIFDFRPSNIIQLLDLRRPIYRDLASYGHFGRTDLDVGWELTNYSKELASEI